MCTFLCLPNVCSINRHLACRCSVAFFLIIPGCFQVACCSVLCAYVQSTEYTTFLWYSPPLLRGPLLHFLLFLQWCAEVIFYISSFSSNIVQGSSAAMISYYVASERRTAASLAFSPVCRGHLLHFFLFLNSCHEVICCYDSTRSYI